MQRKYKTSAKNGFAVSRLAAAVAAKNGNNGSAATSATASPTTAARARAHLRFSTGCIIPDGVSSISAEGGKVVVPEKHLRFDAAKW